MCLNEWQVKRHENMVKYYYHQFMEMVSHWGKWSGPYSYLIRNFK